jgi:hypothetical protein
LMRRRIQWRRLQPVGVSSCKGQTPQAEACATKTLVKNAH